MKQKDKDGIYSKQITYILDFIGPLLTENVWYVTSHSMLLTPTWCQPMQSYAGF